MQFAQPGLLVTGNWLNSQQQQATCHLQLNKDNTIDYNVSQTFRVNFKITGDIKINTALTFIVRPEDTLSAVCH